MGRGSQYFSSWGSSWECLRGNCMYDGLRGNCMYGGLRSNCMYGVWGAIACIGACKCKCELHVWVVKIERGRHFWCQLAESHPCTCLSFKSLFSFSYFSFFYSLLFFRNICCLSFISHIYISLFSFSSFPFFHSAFYFISHIYFTFLFVFFSFFHSAFNFSNICYHIFWKEFAQLSSFDSLVWAISGPALISLKTIFFVIWNISAGNWYGGWYDGEGIWEIYRAHIMRLRVW